jgi:hypothetical protein
MNDQDELRRQVQELLAGGHAHMSLDDAVADFPEVAYNQVPPNVPYTPYHLLEHMRIAQWDILRFVLKPDHVSPDWPSGYWPARDARADVADWERTLESFREDLGRLQELAADPEVDLLAEISHAPGYTVLRELLLAADHNAYHTGEFAILRQVMGTWPSDR